MDDNENKKYNTGTVEHIPSNVNEREKAFKEWSEGSKELEELLHYLYNNNIDTIYCCLGHYEGDIGYIAFNYSDEKKANYIKLVNELLKENAFFCGLCHNNINNNFNIQNRYALSDTLFINIKRILEEDKTNIKNEFLEEYFKLQNIQNLDTYIMWQLEKRDNKYNLIITVYKLNDGSIKENIFNLLKDLEQININRFTKEEDKYTIQYKLQLENFKSEADINILKNILTKIKEYNI